MHRAIVNDQDVYLSDHIDQKPVTGQWLGKLFRSWNDPNMPEPNGPDYSIEVTKVLYGNLKPGVILTIPETNCDDINVSDTETVVIRFSDWQMLYVHYDSERTGEVYTSISGEAFDWYQSLTEKEIEEYAARMQDIWKKKLERRQQQDN